MKILIILTTVLTILFSADNPKAYSALGDVIYDNVDKIEKLKEMPMFRISEDRIENRVDDYIDSVNEARMMGFALDNKTNKFDKKEYIKKLRELTKIHKEFITRVETLLNSSISDENSELFLKLVESGLLDIKKNKNKIKSYYLKHSDEIEENEFIKEALKEEKKTPQGPSQKEIKAKKYKKLKEDRIEKLREKEKAKDEAVKRLIEEEFQRKKREIIEEQKEELTR